MSLLHLYAAFLNCSTAAYKLPSVSREYIGHGGQTGGWEPMPAPWWPHSALWCQEMDLGIFIHRGMRWAYETWGGGGRLGIPLGAAIEARISWSCSPLPAGFGIVWVSGVKCHCHGLHPGDCVQAALPRGVKPGGLELQLIITRNFNERTPAKRSLEASSKSEEKQATGSHVFRWKFPSIGTKSSS